MAKGPARTFGQDLMRGEHIVGAGPTPQQPAQQNGGVLMPSHTSGDPSFYAKKRAKEAELGRELTTEEFLADHYAASDAPTASGTSILSRRVDVLTIVATLELGVFGEMNSPGSATRSAM